MCVRWWRINCILGTILFSLLLFAYVCSFPHRFVSFRTFFVLSVASALLQWKEYLMCNMLLPLYLTDTFQFRIHESWKCILIATTFILSLQKMKFLSHFLHMMQFIQSNKHEILNTFREGTALSFAFSKDANSFSVTVFHLIMIWLFRSTKYTLLHTTTDICNFRVLWLTVMSWLTSKRKIRKKRADNLRRCSQWNAFE